jgi:hypothetical protein
MNPTLSDLIGGIQSVTLGDEEARRRRTQKSVLERKAPPTFDALVEIQSFTEVAVHSDVAQTVDDILRGGPARPTLRRLSPEGGVQEILIEGPTPLPTQAGEAAFPTDVTGLYPFGVSRSRLEMGIRTLNLPFRLVDRLERADVLLTTKQLFRKKAQFLNSAQAAGVPVYVLRTNSPPQIDQALAHLAGRREDATLAGEALEETERAIQQVLTGEPEVELSPQSPQVRRLQHQLASEHNIASRSSGREPHRRVRLHRSEG